MHCVSTLQKNYNILFIVTDQERYLESHPVGTSWCARELLQSIGATFEKHYISSNMSTPSRSVIYTGQHITSTMMSDNTDVPWQNALCVSIPTMGHKLRSAGYYTAYKGKFHLSNYGAMKIPGAESNQDSEIKPSDQLEVYGFSDWNCEGEIAGGMLDGFYKDDYISSSAIRWHREK